MAETCGRVVVQATPEILQAFTIHRDKGLEKLVAYSGADGAINDECDVFFAELDIKGDSGCFEFEGMYWSQTAERLAATGQNIGLYLRSMDEYGSQFFLAQNPNGERFSFFAGGPDDDFEVEGGDVVTKENLEKWLAVIPESIKQAFPQLLEVSVD
jgi:hypothetical protein